MKAILRRIRISPKKANLIAALVRNKKAVDAVDTLNFTPKKAAKILKTLIESAIANAEANFKQKKEDLVIKEIIVNPGSTHKRSVPISRGRMHPRLKRTSHITVTVEALETTKKKEVKKEEPKKEEAPKAEKIEKKVEKKETPIKESKN